MESQSQRQSGIYLFGERSKAGNWIINHPFHIAVFVTFIGLLIAIFDKTTPIWPLIKGELMLIGAIFIWWFLCRNLCYWVEIDTVYEKIKFYRCFNKGIVEAPLRSVEFVFDKHFACYYAGKRFTIFNEYMYGIAEILPPGMHIRFAEGFFARLAEKQFDRNAKRWPNAQRYKK